MLQRYDRASMVLYFVEMAQTRGGKTPPVVPPQIYMTPLGVKVRKVNGGYVFQPPSLKVSSYLTLNKFKYKGWTAPKSIVRGSTKIYGPLA